MPIRVNSQVNPICVLLTNFCNCTKFAIVTIPKLLQNRSISPFTGQYPYKVHPESLRFKFCSVIAKSIQWLGFKMTAFLSTQVGTVGVRGDWSLVNCIINVSFSQFSIANRHWLTEPIRKGRKLCPLITCSERNYERSENLAGKEGHHVRVYHGKLMNSLSRSKSLFFRLRRWLISDDPLGVLTRETDDNGLHQCCRSCPGGLFGAKMYNPFQKRSDFRANRWSGREMALKCNCWKWWKMAKLNGADSFLIVGFRPLRDSAFRSLQLMINREWKFPTRWAIFFHLQR